MIRRFHKTRNVPYRRKREGKTDYRKRLKLLLSHKPRLVIRKSLDNVIAQIVEYGEKGDKVVVSAHSNELKKLGWKFGKGNVPAAYLTGLLAGVKAKKKKVTEAVLDLGLQASVKGSRIYACLKGVLDAGINIPHDKGILPSDDRVLGKHIADYGSKSKQFKANVSELPKAVEDMKKKIIA